MKSMPPVQTPITRHVMFRRWTAIRHEILNSNYPANNRRRHLKCVGLDNFREFVFFVDREIGGPLNTQSKLNRIDHRRGWIPGNIRWTDQKGVAQTQHNIYNLKWRGKTYSMQALSDLSPVSYASFRNRIHRGWSLNKAMTTPPLRKNGKHK